MVLRPPPPKGSALHNDRIGWINIRSSLGYSQHSYDRCCCCEQPISGLNRGTKQCRLDSFNQVGHTYRHKIRLHHSFRPGLMLLWSRWRSRDHGFEKSHMRLKRNQAHRRPQICESAAYRLTKSVYHSGGPGPLSFSARTRAAQGSPQVRVSPDRSIWAAKVLPVDYIELRAVSPKRPFGTSCSGFEDCFDCINHVL